MVYTVSCPCKQSTVAKTVPLVYNDSINLPEALMIRSATYDDLDRIGEIFDAARERMHTGGNPNQWINGYPARKDTEKDINNGNCYVICDESGVRGVFTYIKGIEPTYGYIDGKWLNGEPYGTIHRIASDGAYHGTLKEAAAFCMDKRGNLRIDTHRDNAPMLAAIEKCGFTKCGIIYLDEEKTNERVAFQMTEI